MIITPPTDRQLYETEIATYWMDDDGILNSISKPPRRTLENTSANFALVRRITGDRKVGHLVYICNSPVPDKATREYVARELPTVYKAMAMVSNSGLGLLIMSILFRF